MVFLLINEYHSLADFLFDGNCTKIRSLSDIFSSYKSENEWNVYRYTFIDFTRKKERKIKNWHRFSSFNLNWKLNGRMTHGPKMRVYECQPFFHKFDFQEKWKSKFETNFQFSRKVKIKIWDQFSIFQFKQVFTSWQVRESRTNKDRKATKANLWAKKWWH